MTTLFQTHGRPKSSGQVGQDLPDPIMLTRMAATSVDFILNLATPYHRNVGMVDPEDSETAVVVSPSMETIQIATDFGICPIELTTELEALSIAATSSLGRLYAVCKSVQQLLKRFTDLKDTPVPTLHALERLVAALQDAKAFLLSQSMSTWTQTGKKNSDKPWKKHMLMCARA
jgi:hypothetical protein